MNKAAIGLVALSLSASLANDARAESFADNPLCAAGSPDCVPLIIAEMQQRFAALGCEHDAIFSFLYLRTTEKFLETLDTIGYSDKLALVREDALFADYYFRAFDAYHSIPAAPVPEAWRIAFDAAKNHTVSAYGNALLGVTAHIRRDQPFMLYELDKQRHSAVSYPDHKLVNIFLNQVWVPEIYWLFDQTFGVPTTPVDPYLVEVWRQLAWNDYIQLKNAPNDATRAIVAQQIEDAAAREAESIVQRYTNTAAATATRDAYCAAAHAAP